MFIKKKISCVVKYTKLITCAVLAVCIAATVFTAIPLATSADSAGAADVKDAIFVGKIGMDNCAGTFIPVDIANASGSDNLYSGDAYFKLTFSCKMLSGTKPVIGVMRVDAGTAAENTYTEPTWCDNAADVTVSNGVCVAYFKVNFSKRFNPGDCGWRSFYITVGNAEHDGGGISEKDNTVSFIMSDARLVACDSSHNVTDGTNLLPEFSGENINFGGTYYTRSDGCGQWDSPRSAVSMKWHIDSNSFAVKHITVPGNYNTSSDYDAANFTLHPATDNLREYYTNEKYAGVYFEKLANSGDKGFGIISDDLNKKFVLIDANHNGEPDVTATEYVPQKNKVANIFVPLSLGQFSLSGGNTSNAKVILKVTFKAARIEGDGPPVLGRVIGHNSGTDGKGSWAWGLATMNARGSGYYTKYDRSDNGGGIRPQCEYNATTGEFVGWVGMEFDNSDLATRWGVNEVLTIGNAEHVYETGKFDSTSFNSSFAISDIKVDLYNVSLSGNVHTPTTLIAEDIAPALNADSVDTENSWYFDYKNGNSNHEKDLIRASQNIWHIDGEKSLVSFIDLSEIKGYATKYSVTHAGATGTISRFMTLGAGKTYQYVFRSKYESADRAKPLLEFKTASGTKKISTDNYQRDKNRFNNTVFTFKTPADLVASKNTRIGIDIPNANVSGTFGGFELYEIGEDGMAKTEMNLMKAVYISESEVFLPYSADASEDVWMKEGTVGNDGTTFDVVYKDDDFYRLPSTSKMLAFAGMNNSAGDTGVEYACGNGSIKQYITVKADTKYRFTADLKYCGTGGEGETVGFAFAAYNKLGKERELTDITDLSDAVKFNAKYEFTTPKSMLAGAGNFSITFSVPSGYVSGYISNIRMQEIDAGGNVTGDNLVTNGDFSTGDISGWTKSGSFYIFKFFDIPDNFFLADPTHNIHAIQYRDTADYALIQQMMIVKPNTRYEVSYTSLLTGYNLSESYGVLYQKLWKDAEHSDSSWTYMQDNERNAEIADPTVVTTTEVLNKATFGDDFDASEHKNQSLRVKKVFTTDNLLRVDTDTNLSVRFYFMSGTSGYLSDYAVYEIDENGNRIGNNLILDGDFSCGYEVFDNSTPWRYSNEGTVRNIELEKGFFENYTVSSKMIRSDGSAANQTYGNQLYVDPGSRYYFSGYYVKTNFEGLSPEILYRSVKADGAYVSISFEEYFDASKYYFETDGGFIIPDDAFINGDGKADIIVRLNNRDHGKGYFCGLTLTQDNSGKNLFDESKADIGKFISMDYDSEKFMPFEGDEGFEDGDWSGENSYNIETGAVSGTVLDVDGYTYPGVTMKLTPGNIEVVTDGSGAYIFEKLKPGNYTLYLVESSGNEIFCTDIAVKAGILITLPDIYYDDNLDEVEIDDGEIEIDGDDSIREQKYGALKGYCYDSSGKLLSGIDIYVNSKSHHTKTDSKGVFMFDKVPPGEYKICTVLSDGSVYVFRTAKIEAGKGTVIRVMMPDENGFPLWLIIVIIAGGVVLVAAGVLTVILLVKKKKKKEQLR